MSIAPPFSRKNVRTLFLSDLHLGSVGARADIVLEFLHSHRAETYFLVGDILDVWESRDGHWPTEAQRVIDHLHIRRCEGAEVVYVRGNHDPIPEAIVGPRNLPGPAVTVTVHAAADGRRYLVTHGDEEDHGPFQIGWLQRAGSTIDHMLRRTDQMAAGIAQRAGIGSGRGLMPLMVAAFNRALYRFSAHEHRMLNHARALALDGVICGHFHLPALTRHGTLTYANCGDWLDHFVALAEDHSGMLHLLEAVPGRFAKAAQGDMQLATGVSA